MTNNVKTKESMKRQQVDLSSEQQKKAKQVVNDALMDNPEAFNLPVSKHTADELTDYFVRAVEGSQRILPKERRRYVMYLRKSTDDEQKQVRSLADQETE